MVEASNRDELETLQDLIVRYLDDALTAEQLSRLNELLLARPQYRRYLVRNCLQVAGIREITAKQRAKAVTPLFGDRPAAPARPARPWTRIISRPSTVSSTMRFRPASFTGNR